MSLGKRQQAVLAALREHGSWRAGELHSWKHGSESETKATLEALLRRGFVCEEHGRYYPIEAMAKAGGPGKRARTSLLPADPAEERPKRKRQCVTSAEAIPAKGQNTEACADCPWARASLNGWLGPHTADGWLSLAHGEARIECHTLKGAQCAGASIYRANNGKLPRDSSLLRLPADREKVFSSPQEFKDHHAKHPDVPAKRRAGDLLPTKTGNKIQDALEEIRTTLANVSEPLSKAEYKELLEELMADAEGWRMELQELEKEDESE